MQKKKVVDHTSLKEPLMHNPFDRLKGLIDRKNLPPSKLVPQTCQAESEAASVFPPEEHVFLEAMEGVSTIDRDNVFGKNANIKLAVRPKYIHENEELSQLVRLVDQGEGFIVSDTPEYIEGTGYNVHQEFARRLHLGDFSIQAHIDLHGLNVESAKEVFDAFLNASIKSGKNAVLIIHGRGLSSPGDSILKNKVREWLSHSYWLKRVVAYASAQSHDGGAGATYVLLRSKPVSKRSGKVLDLPKRR